MTTSGNEALRGISVIVVEDNWAIATALRDALSKRGCDVQGLAGTENAALELVRSRTFDVAVLDVQLGARDVTDVASRVREQGKAIVYVSGYRDLDMLPPELRSYPRLDKPIDENELVSAVLASAPQAGA